MLRGSNVESGGVPSWKFSNFASVYLFWYMYESDNAKFDDGLHVECRARDWHKRRVANRGRKKKVQNGHEK